MTFIVICPDPPVITTNFPADELVEGMSSAVLVCSLPDNISGRNKLRWLKVGSEEKLEQVSYNAKDVLLILNNLGRQHSGMYRCTAATPYGSMHTNISISLSCKIVL